MSMLARKGTMVRKGRGGGRPLRRPPAPRQLDPEGALGAGPSPATSLTQLRPTSPAHRPVSYTNYDDEKHLCPSPSQYSEDSFPEGGYGTFLMQLQEANEDAQGPWDFLTRVLEVIWQSGVMTGCLALVVILPVVMLGVGSYKLEECPKEPKLPLFLLIGGSFGLVKVLLLLWRQRRERKCQKLDYDDSDDAVMARSAQFTGYIISLFLLVWFVFGNIWVFRVWLPNFTQPLHAPSDWCDPTVFWGAFYTLIGLYALLGLVILTLICILLFYGYKALCRRREG